MIVARIWQALQFDLVALGITIGAIIIARVAAPLMGVDWQDLALCYALWLAAKCHLRIEQAGLK